MHRVLLGLCSLALAACGGGASDLDGGGFDAAQRDGGRAEDAGADASAADPDAFVAVDAGPEAADAAVSDASSDAAMDGCAPMDVREGEPCGPTERPGRRYRWNGTECEAVHWCRCEGADCEGLFDAEEDCRAAYVPCVPGACASDFDCTFGEEWCVGGRCEACDNSALFCRIACPHGWSLYERNGCHPCECAPPNACTKDEDCTGEDGGECYAGAFCWDWCPPGDPSCCMGNVCSAPGCAPPHPAGCVTRGCPAGEECSIESSCEPSSCGCGGEGAWFCTRDCGGGACVAPEE